ncbi:MAG: hypothetical protein QOK49_698 [Baekduia sp.]|jgi:uncharacterized membrane protein HdeD (DUF308 family)|nr:hypothetical protein [Baekduia sp.]
MAAGSKARAWESWWVPAAAGALSAIAGVLAIVWPGITLLALALITGINMVILGAFFLGDAIVSDDHGDRTLRVVLGVVGIIAGLIVVRRPGETLLVLIMAAGIWLVLSGTVDVIRGILVASEQRVLRIAGGLIDIALGIGILALPELSLATVAVLVGVSFIVRGVLLVVAGWRLRSSGAGERPRTTPVAPTAA